MLEQKWLTYLLAFLLVLLVAVFVVLATPKYKNWVVDHLKGIFHKEKKVPRPRPGLGFNPDELRNVGIAKERGAEGLRPCFVNLSLQPVLPSESSPAFDLPLEPV
jgi:hypothetical protein